MNKPGRNEPCFCGSGKKYKHCCGSIKNKLSKSRIHFSPKKASSDNKIISITDKLRKP